MSLKSKNEVLKDELIREQKREEEIDLVIDLLTALKSYPFTKVLNRLDDVMRLLSSSMLCKQPNWREFLKGKGAFYDYLNCYIKENESNDNSSSEDIKEDLEENENKKEDTVKDCDCKKEES